MVIVFQKCFLRGNSEYLTIFNFFSFQNTFAFKNIDVYQVAWRSEANFVRVSLISCYSSRRIVVKNKSMSAILGE